MACSLGLCLFVAALVSAPPARVPRWTLTHGAAAVVCAGTVAVTAAAVERWRLVALALLGLVFAAAAVVVAFVKALYRNRPDDSDGGGGPGRGDDPQPWDGPGGDGAEWDWAAFEEEAYAAYRDSGGILASL